MRSRFRKEKEAAVVEPEKARKRSCWLVFRPWFILCCGFLVAFLLLLSLEVAKSRVESDENEFIRREPVIVQKTPLLEDTSKGVESIKPIEGEKKVKDISQDGIQLDFQSSEGMELLEETGEDTVGELELDFLEAVKSSSDIDLGELENNLEVMHDDSERLTSDEVSHPSDIVTFEAADVADGNVNSDKQETSGPDQTFTPAEDSNVETKHEKEEDEEIEDDNEDLTDDEIIRSIELMNLGGSFDGQSVQLKKQITLPENGNPLFQNANVDKNFWPVQSALKKQGWVWAQKASPGNVHMMFTKGKIPNFFKSGKQLLNSIGLSGCIGGSKTLQLQCRERLAEKHGCKYTDLGIQPAQFPMSSEKSCLEFFEKAKKEENREKLWLYKPSNTYHGAGIELYRGPTKLWKKFDKCNRRSLKKGIMMEYISKPATINGGYKFDFRTYLLVGSLQPQLVFYHDGFVRKSDTKYSEHSRKKNTHVTNAVSQSSKDHFFNFTYLNHALHQEMAFPLDYISRAREYLKRVTLYMFHTARVQPQPLGRINGRWHIFGVDWMIDQYGHIHLLEGNGYPLVSHYPGIGLTPKVWKEMTDLILDIHTNPESLDKKMTVQDDFKYGDWTLVFNELEHHFKKQKGDEYNPCNVFPLSV